MSAWLVAVLAGAAAALLVPGRGRADLLSSRALPGRLPRIGWPWPSRSGDDASAVQEACDVLASELAAGRPVADALAVAAARWPALAPVEESLRLGADVPEAWRAVAAERRGAADLRLVAAAWQVSAESGHGLARALHRVGHGLRRRARTRRVVESELASARSTARLVALLPVAVLLMGRGSGGDPLAFLLGAPVGWLCLVSGLLLLAAGLGWIELIAARATR